MLTVIFLGLAFLISLFIIDFCTVCNYQMHALSMRMRGLKGTTTSHQGLRSKTPPN